MGLLNWVKNLKLWGILSAIIAVLIGIITMQNIRISSKNKEIDNLEKKKEITKFNTKVREFQAINKERKDIADEKLDKELDTLDIRLNGSTTYEL